MRTKILLLLPLAAGIAAASVSAQTISAVVPQAAEPGDLVVLRGTGLGATSQVRFTGQVGGFVGVWNVSVAPLSVSATEVRALVPTFNNFVGPAATPPSDPFGSVALVGGMATPKADFYFMEEKHGQVTTPGAGTTLSNGERAVCHFDLGGGEPVSNNPAFAPRVGLAVPGTLPFLAVGNPATPPFFPIGDGDLVIDFTSPIFAVLTAPAVDANGDSGLALPIPKICPMPMGTFEDPVCGVPVALQWGFFNPTTGAFAVSSGMFVTL